MCKRDGESIDSGSPGLGFQSIPLGPRLTRGAFAVLPKPSVYIMCKNLSRCFGVVVFPLHTNRIEIVVNENWNVIMTNYFTLHTPVYNYNILRKC